MITLPCSGNQASPLRPRVRELRRRIAGLSACVVLTAAGCSPDNAPPNPSHIESAESILDAFYSWDSDSLGQRLASAEGSGAMLYYQKWAEAAHYELEERRPCEQVSTSSVRCAITVTDDFGMALGYTATDTFAFGFSDAGVTLVEFEGDDPAIFTALFAWMAVYRGEVFENECRDMFSTGTTPADCARSVADAANAFVEWSPFH